MALAQRQDSTTDQIETVIEEARKQDFPVAWLEDWEDWTRSESADLVGCYCIIADEAGCYDAKDAIMRKWEAAS